jgi:hypothetical protein
MVRGVLELRKHKQKPNILIHILVYIRERIDIILSGAVAPLIFDTKNGAGY